MATSLRDAITALIAENPEDTDQEIAVAARLVLTAEFAAKRVADAADDADADVVYVAAVRANDPGAYR